MKNKLEEILTVEDCHELLRYDSEKGILYWKERNTKWFSDNGNGGSIGVCNRWNGLNANKPALNALNRFGYRAGSILGYSITAHRVIFFMHNGWWPVLVDHVNRNRSDNRLENLRASDKAKNARNRKRSSANKSGAAGVHKVKKTGKWTAVISLGTFDTLEEAIAKRKWADEIWDYHVNHGRKQENENQ